MSDELAPFSLSPYDRDIQNLGLGRQRRVAGEPQRQSVGRVVPALVDPIAAQQRSVDFLDAQQFMRIWRSRLRMMADQCRVPHPHVMQRLADVARQAEPGDRDNPPRPPGRRPGVESRLSVAAAIVRKLRGQHSVWRHSAQDN
jgi:hypothetical protein